MRSAVSPEPLAAPVPSSHGSPDDIPALSPAGAAVPPHATPTSPSLKRPPKDSKVYKAALATVALRAQGVKFKVIAETLGYTEETVRSYLKYAVKRGWLNMASFAEPEDQLEYVLKTKVTRNVSEFLDNRDKDVTLEAAKGLGMFKTHQVVKGDAQTQIGVALRVQVEMPPSSNVALTVRPGTVGGAPGTEIPQDAEIIESE